MSQTVGLVALHAHLEVTGRRPVETAASRWLGEAEAIAADLAATTPVESSVAVDRLGTIVELLGEVDGIEDPVADAHLSFASRVADRLLQEHRCR